MALYIFIADLYSHVFHGIILCCSGIVEIGSFDVLDGYFLIVGFHRD